MSDERRVVFLLACGVIGFSLLVTVVWFLGGWLF